MAIRVELVELSVHVPAPEGAISVLDGLSMVVEPGELVALVGPSGSGKTTLLNVVGGLEPDHEGRVLLDGHPAWEAGESERARTRNAHLGFVFQDANLLQGLTARENLVLPLLLRPPGGPDPEARADELLDAMGLLHKANTRAERLSGGERQRVATARALVGDPGLVLVDEPTGNLDADNAQRITEILLAHRMRTGATLLIATHDDRVVSRADRILRMDGGRLHAAV